MEKDLFSPMESDALGEMMNISLGSSATAMSNLLEHRVVITTPKVTAVKREDFVLGNLEPAMGVEIKYVEGLSGSNLMLLKRGDIKVIVDILMGGETPDEEFELNELTISAVCEVMNQMMGSAATAMSDFLGYEVDISTPQPFDLNDVEAFKRDHLPPGEEVVMVRFSLKIEGALESEFMNVMSVDLAKELLKGLGLDENESVEPEPIPASAVVSAPEPASAPAPAAAPASASAAAPTPEPSSNRKLSQEEIEALLASMASEEPAPAPAPDPAPSPAPAAQPQPTTPPQPQPAVQPAAAQAAPQAFPAVSGAQPATAADLSAMMATMMSAMTAAMANNAPHAAAAPEPKVINTRPAPLKDLDPSSALGKEQAKNLDLIMEVPLQVTVEIGRTQRKVQDILEFAKGSLVVLDKLAGDQVDLFVNGKCVARGDVVVIDDNFGVRITEIVQEPIVELVQK